jgi:hypothetical protein
MPSPRETRTESAQSSAVAFSSKANSPQKLRFLSFSSPPLLLCSQVHKRLPSSLPSQFRAPLPSLSLPGLSRTRVIFPSSLPPHLYLPILPASLSASSKSVLGFPFLPHFLPFFPSFRAFRLITLVLDSFRIVSAPPRRLHLTSPHLPAAEIVVPKANSERLGPQD